MDIKNFYKNKIYKLLCNDSNFDEAKNKICNIIDRITDDVYVNRKLDDLIKRNPMFFYFDRYEKIKIFYSLNDYLYLINSGGFGIVFRCDNSYCLKLIFEYNDIVFRHEYDIPVSIKERLEERKMKQYIEFMCVPDVILEDLSCRNLKLLVILYSFSLLTCRNIIERRLDLSKCKQFDRQISDFTEIADIYSKYKNNTKFYIIFSNIYNKYIKEYTNIILLNNYNSLMKFLSNYKINFKKTLKDNVLRCNVLLERLALETSDCLRLDDSGEVIPNGTKAYEKDNNYLRLLVLQTFLFISAVNKCFDYFVHNDLKMNNILVFAKERPLIINFNSTTRFEFLENYVFKINDFDFSSHDSLTNRKISESKFSNNDNWIYDVHFFVHSLFLFITHEKFIKIDNNLYTCLKDYFLLDCKSDKMRCNTHIEKKDISYLDDFILKKGKLFTKWIKITK